MPSVFSLGTFFAFLLLASSAVTIALASSDTLADFDTCVNGQWISIPSYAANLVFYFTIAWAAALQCIPKCFPLRKRQQPVTLAVAEGQEMQHVTRLGVADTANDVNSSSSSSSVERPPARDSNTADTVEESSFDWNSCWLLLFSFLYYLGYDASIKASLVFGIDDALRSPSISSTCGLDENHAQGIASRREDYARTEAIYKISPTILRAWLLFFMMLFVAVRRKGDPWLLSSYCCGKSVSRHGIVERFVHFAMFLQCIQFTLQVYLNGLATKKQVACSFIVLSLASLIFFFTLHVLQADLHPTKKSLRPQVATLPGNYMWCTSSVLVYWACGFLFYLNSGSESFSRNEKNPFMPYMGISDSILYCLVHVATWIVFGMVSWGSKERPLREAGAAF